MTEDRFHLTGKEILEKDFKTSMRGYNQEEVDEFLDLVIKDYEQYDELIKDLKAENERLKKSRSVSAGQGQVERQETRSRQSTPTNQSNPSNHQVNYDILKRLSNLEKAVFGNRYADE
ncbi:cell division regulator GpsB [Salimicrobium halophilum]|uniref:DivIVA domain-containing protein n=1 Tax=Salimicrobium halophilum TaxID=86666 RepID=A0A1G8Q2J5_9BACI|nr:cell division regulator GpsB [Salimicrobium halophilum]SDI98931.1 DivIVA domain-containing protein [Salimicrobium halophilum]